MHSDSQTLAVGELGQFDIIDGPNKFDIMAALFVGPWSSSGKVSFRVNVSAPSNSGVGGITVGSFIFMVRAKNHEDESWVLEGHLFANERDGWQSAQITAHYSSKTRKGRMKILPKKVLPRKYR